MNGVAIIAHGSSNARAIRNAIRAAANEALVRHVNAEIVEVLQHSPETMVAKPGGKGIRGLFLRMRGRLHRHPERGGKPESSREFRPVANGPAPKTVDVDQRAGTGSLLAEVRVVIDDKTIETARSVNGTSSNAAIAGGTHLGNGSEPSIPIHREDHPEVSAEDEPPKREPS